MIIGTGLLIAVTAITTLLILLLGSGFVYLILNASKIDNIIHRLDELQKYMHHIFTDANNVPQQQLWRTADGKYTASSFEELLAKMANDPDSSLTEDQVQTLKDIFGKILRDTSKEDDDDIEEWS
jgi:hypothetical protein